MAGLQSGVPAPAGTQGVLGVPENVMAWNRTRSSAVWSGTGPEAQLRGKAGDLVGLWLL